MIPLLAAASASLFPEPIKDVVFAISPSFTSSRKQICATPSAGFEASDSMAKIPISGKADPKEFRVAPGGILPRCTVTRFATTTRALLAELPVRSSLCGELRAIQVH